MASTSKEVVTVTELTKYGFKTANDNNYWNWSKKCTDQGKVVPGGQYEMDIYTADSGKKYVNAVIKEVGQGIKLPVKKVVKEEIKEPTKVYTDSKVFQRDFDKEAKGKTRCALFCAALQSPFTASLSTEDQLKEFVKSWVGLGMATIFSEDK